MRRQELIEGLDQIESAIEATRIEDALRLTHQRSSTDRVTISPSALAAIKAWAVYVSQASNSEKEILRRLELNLLQDPEF